MLTADDGHEFAESIGNTIGGLKSEVLRLEKQLLELNEKNKEMVLDETDNDTDGELFTEGALLALRLQEERNSEFLVGMMSYAGNIHEQH